MKTVLTLAGLDPTSGAGVQSDVITLYQNGVYPFSIPTAITGQNAHGVFYRQDLSVEDILMPLKILYETYTPDVVKIGMVGNVHQLKALYQFFTALPKRPMIVLDPVMVASSGKVLMDPDAILYLRETFLPLVTLITPNLDEYKVLFETTPPDAINVLLKGGHADDHANDILYASDGTVTVFPQERIHAPFSHGTGCTLSSAIAAGLAKGQNLVESVGEAKQYLLEGLKNPIRFSETYGAIRK